MNLGPIVSHIDRVAYLRHLFLFVELGQIIKYSLINRESVLEIPPAKCESGTSEGIHFERHRSLLKCPLTHSMDTE